MIETRTISDDPVMGIRRLGHYDYDTDEFWVETINTNLPQLAEQNHELHKNVTSLDRWGDGQRVAQIPITVFHQLKKQGIVDDEQRFKRWLNDRDNQVFRTRPGRV